MREVFGHNLRRLRQRKGMNQQQLSDRVRQLGGSLDRTAIARVESVGRADSRKVTIDDLVLLATALDTTPMHLLIPFGHDETLDVTREVQVTGAVARRWFRGWEPLPGQDAEAYFDQVPRQDRFFQTDPHFGALADAIERESLGLLNNDPDGWREAVDFENQLGHTIHGRLMGLDREESE
ncbi:MAG: helix-turn-helix transcriptional regulator [Acidimicrobiales bacterium]|nr:helix-turn-helix transcriptional regulator [Acidimicrobiales bacterium]